MGHFALEVGLHGLEELVDRRLGRIRVQLFHGGHVLVGQQVVEAADVLADFDERAAVATEQLLESPS